MPCYNGDDDNGDVSGSDYDRVVKQVEWRDAALCALITVAEKYGNLEDVLGAINWKEAGIERKDFENWWKEHKEKDEIRKKRELAKAARKKQEKIKKAKRKEILAKLSEEEKNILGVK